MSRDETPLSVFENDDELLSFKLFKETNGNLDPYDLSSAVIDFIVKTNASDSSPLFTYSTATSEIAITSATGGLFTIQFARANLTVPGNYRYQLRVTQNSKRRTVAWGTLTVENV
jgi:hypothetical protein